MKSTNSKSFIHTSFVALSIVLCLLMGGTSYLWAGSSNDAGQIEGLEGVDGVVEGSFDALDLKARRIWINDMVYKLDRNVKVKGTHRKLGLITDLKAGEIIKATLLPNEDQPTIPYVMLIERQ
jgi:hypothetical protein